MLWPVRRLPKFSPGVQLVLLPQNLECSLRTASWFYMDSTLCKAQKEISANEQGYEQGSNVIWKEILYWGTVKIIMNENRSAESGGLSGSGCYSHRSSSVYGTVIAGRNSWPPYAIFGGRWRRLLVVPVSRKLPAGRFHSYSLDDDRYLGVS